MEERQNKKDFEEMLSDFSPEVRALGSGARELILKMMPEVFEVVWTRQKIAGYGTGPKKKTEHFCYIAPHKKHVDLGFNYGSELPDPEGLLAGTGNLFRHIKLHKPDDLARPAVRKLLEAASAHRVPPLPKSP